MTTRKADSKGRLSGFAPGGTYDIKIDADEVSVVKRSHGERSRSISVPASQESLDYMTRWGLDPKRVARDGANAKGYFEFLIGTDGERLAVLEGEPDSVWKEWPIGFSYDRFVELSRG